MYCKSSAVVTIAAVQAALGRVLTLLAAGLGFEPRLPDPESGVLPLHHPAK